MAQGPVLFRTRGHLLLCTDRRCRERGADELFVQTWEAFEREGLAYYKSGGAVRLTASGCLGACQHGPNLTCYHRADAEGGPLEEAWYAGVDLERVLSIARAIQRGERPEDDGRYDEG